MTATSDSFIPLVTAPIPAGQMATLKVLAQDEAKAMFEPLPESGEPEPSAKTCVPPSVTLQRQGEIVSAIRIECACGQVIELACTY